MIQLYDQFLIGIVVIFDIDAGSSQDHLIHVDMALLVNEVGLYFIAVDVQIQYQASYFFYS